MQGWIFTLAVSSAICAALLDDKTFVESKTSAGANMIVKFSLSSRKNKTGHTVTKLEMVKPSKVKLPVNWNLDVEHGITEYDEVESVYSRGVFTVFPDVPNDCKLSSKIAQHKFHDEMASSFAAARDVCSKEGGHLAIINSQEEADHIVKLWSKYLSAPNYPFWSAYLGFHDSVIEGEFITIFGQHINSTGYTKWSVNQPDNYGGDEDCGAITRQGLLNDVSCTMELPFVCEYEL